MTKTKNQQQKETEISGESIQLSSRDLKLVPVNKHPKNKKNSSASISEEKKLAFEKRAHSLIELWRRKFQGTTNSEERESERKKHKEMAFSGLQDRSLTTLDTQYKARTKRKRNELRKAKAISKNIPGLTPFKRTVPQSVPKITSTSPLNHWRNSAYKLYRNAYKKYKLGNVGPHENPKNYLDNLTFQSFPFYSIYDLFRQKSNTYKNRSIQKRKKHIENLETMVHELLGRKFENGEDKDLDKLEIIARELLAKKFKNRNAQDLDKLETMAHQLLRTKFERTAAKSLKQDEETVADILVNELQRPRISESSASLPLPSNTCHDQHPSNKTWDGPDLSAFGAVLLDLSRVEKKSQKRQNSPNFEAPPRSKKSKKILLP